MSLISKIKSNKDCIFCKIVSGEKTDEEIVHTSERLIAVMDKFPRTPIQVVILTKKHYHDYVEMISKEAFILNEFGDVLTRIVKKLKIEKKLYTWGFHQGNQSINHSHAQLCSGMAHDELVM